MHALPTVDGLLAAFFVTYRAAAAPARRVLLDRTACDLRLCLELGGEAVMTEADRVVLAAERQFDAVGAVARTLPATALPTVLEGFVRDPLYRPAALGEARDRLDTCGALVRWLARDPESVGSVRPLRRVDEAIRMELAALQPRRRPRRVRG